MERLNHKHGGTMHFAGFWAILSLVLAHFAPIPVHAEASPDSAYRKQSNWVQTVTISRERLAHSGNPKSATEEILSGLENDFPVQWDWILQDAGPNVDAWLLNANDSAPIGAMIRHGLQELGAGGSALQGDLDQLIAQKVLGTDARWLSLYGKVCEMRRVARLEKMSPNARRIIFTQHYNLGGSHYAYTEGQSDAQSERHFAAGTSLCLLEVDGGATTCRTLISDEKGVIRDPEVSFDDKRVLFSWKKSDRMDDYHLYEMEMETGKVRQLTEGLGFVDYEGSYLPNGDIIFNSTRCVQTVDCWWTEVSNLYTCDKDGHNLRRLTFDQVHDNFPTAMSDGRIIYTRWEYNDRGQIFPQGLFQMNADGTGQTALYGNNTWFPTSILHSRGVPNSQKVMAIASGHHTMQAGKLILIDSSKGRQEAAGVQLIAPVRETKAERIDTYGQEGELFQYPYPLSEDTCLVSYHPLGWNDKVGRFYQPHFKIYFMLADGRRELLWGDPVYPCNQPIPLAARPVPLQRAGIVDYRKTTGTFLIQDIYAGNGLPGVPRGTVKRLRVVALDFRAAGVGENGSSGPAGGALSSSPVSINNGSWDAKIVLGDAEVYEDGSAFFQAPARTPVYFQALDEKGHVVQTMRSWATLQPGENASCVGCHEDKNGSVPSLKPLRAMAVGPRPLQPFYGPARPFSFSTEIQPILDRSCVQCHHVRPGEKAVGDHRTNAFSLLAAPNPDPKSGRVWSDSYLALTSSGTSTPRVNWIGVQSVPSMLPPYFAGAAKSKLIEMLEKGHRDVHLLREELDKLSCWIDLLVPFCGDYREASLWNAADTETYDHYLLKRRQMQEMESASVESLITSEWGPQPTVRMELVDAAGEVVRDSRAFAKGDRLRLAGPPYMMVRLGRQLPESLIYTPDGHVEIPIPVGTDEAKAYCPDAFASSISDCSARPATEQELGAYRNLARNPLDIRGWSSFFPHATSNSECRNEGVFAARNAIDGTTGNQRHGGWPSQSWGPEQRTDLWWKVDFGRQVQIDKVVVFIRADFPHDKHWRSATLRFSDGHAEKIQLSKSSAAQTFEIPRRTVSWVQLEDLEQDEPLGWCALTEVEVYGQDVVSK